MKNKDFIVDGKKIGYFDDGMIVVTDPDVIKENQPEKRRNFTFGEAIELLKAGNILTREHWTNDNKDKEKCIYLVDYSRVEKENLRGIAATVFKNAYSGEVLIKPHIDMKEGRTIVCGWTPTAEDILSEDWYITNR